MENFQLLLSFEFPKGSFFIYLIVAAIGSMTIRAIIGFYLSKEWNMPKGSFVKYLLGEPIMRPDKTSKPIRSGDHLLGFFLGLMELLWFPIFFSTKNIVIIGAWLLFKTVHRVNYNPKEKRGLYNRYLFANALMLTFSYLMCRYFFRP